MAAAAINHIDGPEAFAEAFAVSRETLDRLKVYAQLLGRWQKTVNLVAPGSLEDVWHRHFADSAQLWSLRESGSSRRWLDLGSGAGFPGLVLAILANGQSGGHFTLVESDSRKAAFLAEVARETGVAVDILCARIESPQTVAKVGEVDCVTARALAPLPKLVPLIAPFFTQKTAGMLLKGANLASEIAEISRIWQFKTQILPSLTGSGSILLLSELHRKP